MKDQNAGSEQRLLVKEANETREKPTKRTGMKPSEKK